MQDFTINNYGFVILCPERNFGGLKCTVRSIQNYYPSKPYLCVVAKDASKQEIKEFNQVCPTIQAGSSYTSLINLGIQENLADWSYVIMAGVPLRHGTIRRYESFIRSRKDIAFPVINRKWTFDESSINGLFIHRNALHEVGLFDEEESDLGLVRLVWGYKATQKDYKFVALVGVPR